MLGLSILPCSFFYKFPRFRLSFTHFHPISLFLYFVIKIQPALPVTKTPGQCSGLNLGLRSGYGGNDSFSEMYYRNYHFCLSYDFQVRLIINITSTSLEVPYFTVTQITLAMSIPRGNCYIILFPTAELKHIPGFISVQGNRMPLAFHIEEYHFPVVHSVFDNWTCPGRFPCDNNDPACHFFGRVYDNRNSCNSD